MMYGLANRGCERAMLRIRMDSAQRAKPTVVLLSICSSKVVRGFPTRKRQGCRHSITYAVVSSLPLALGG